MALLFAVVLCLGMLSGTALAAERDAVRTEKAVKTAQPQIPQAICEPKTVMFYSTAPFSLNTANRAKNWDGTLEYSTDEEHWTVWGGWEILNSGLYNGLQRLYLRGTDNTMLSTSTAQRWGLSGSKIYCAGNIEKLLDYETVAAGEHPQMAEFCFSFLFLNCDNLVTAPSLRAVELTDYCYHRMFDGCTSLVTAPALPASELADHCYSGMFYGCTSLKNVPKRLPAETLAPHCYHAMFYGCTALKAAPELPATALEEQCYAFMFMNCSALETPPELPATTLAYACYVGMFTGCTALRTAPSLYAKETARACYFEMFMYCTSLTSVPALPATVLENSCYAYMFAGCTGLRLSAVETNEYATPYRVPAGADAEYAAENALTNMFAGTGGTFTGTPELETVYYLHDSNTVVW